jgi:hypothetical protein
MMTVGPLSSSPLGSCLRWEERPFGSFSKCLNEGASTEAPKSGKKQGMFSKTVVQENGMLLGWSLH